MNELARTDIAPPSSVIEWPREALQLMALCDKLKQARTLPQWCQNSSADLFFAVQSLLRVHLDPFMALRHISMIKGNLFFDGQLCGAILANSGRLAGNLTYEYSGEGDDRTITVRGRLVNETTERDVKVRLGDARTETNANWKNNPDQQLSYKGTRDWARRHCNEALLGIRFIDEAAEMIDVTPRLSPTMSQSQRSDVIEKSAAELHERATKGAAAGGGAETVSDEEAVPFSVPRDSDLGEAASWSSWATTLLAYIKAAGSANTINDWINANADELAALSRFNMMNYKRLVDMINHQIAVRRETGDDA